MKKRKTAAFLAALMICAWVPQAVPGDSGVLVAEAHSGRTDRYGGHRAIKIRADWAATTITAAAIRPICTKTASAPMHLM